MQTFAINFLALLVATIVKTGTGMIWFARPVSGTRWFKYVNCTEDDLRRRMAMIQTGVISSR